VLTALAAFEVVSPLAAAWPSLGATRAAARRLAAITDAGPTVSEVATPLAPPDGRELEVRRLSFRYPETGRDVLRDVSFALRPGQCIAVVGTSGAGKSTIASLLLRFYEAPAGSILLDGRDVRDYETDAVRACLSYSDQRASILTGTLRENLLIAREDADDEAMLEVLRAVGLDERVRSLPQGLDSWIGEQGQHLSGGERQRLALARAILRPAPFLILDEPGAHLDPLAEQQVLLTLTRLARDRGVILITHRVVDLGLATEILVLREGRVVERGTFESLRRAGGWFSRMLDLQRSEAVIETGAGPNLPPASGAGGN
jgi:ATP-binding cassette subfamily C protein CydC